MTDLDVESDPAPIILSALEFDVLWEHLRPGRMPLVVKVPSPGKTHEERTRLAMRVWSTLAERGLGRPGALDDGLVTLLTALGRPDLELDGRLWLSGRNVRVLAAISGETGVRAVLDGEELRLSPVVRTGLTRAVLDVLPAGPQGPGTPSPCAVSTWIGRPPKRVEIPTHWPNAWPVRIFGPPTRNYSATW